VGRGLLARLYRGLVARCAGFSAFNRGKKLGGAAVASLEKGFNDLSFLVCEVRKGL